MYGEGAILLIEGLHTGAVEQDHADFVASGTLWSEDSMRKRENAFGKHTLGTKGTRQLVLNMMLGEPRCKFHNRDYLRGPLRYNSFGHSFQDSESYLVQALHL
jgi:hypothetical protein